MWKHKCESLYSQLPSVLAELISNSWDTDADNVSIDFIDKNGEKEIHFADDGGGMSLQELNDHYLVIGRNRRHASGSEETTYRELLEQSKEYHKEFIDAYNEHNNLKVGSST